MLHVKGNFEEKEGKMAVRRKVRRIWHINKMK